MTTDRESVVVLQECIELQKKKSNDYQNPNSSIVQSMHYRRGVSTIHDMIHQKLLRAQSLLEVAEQGDGVQPNFESLEDTYKDMINYCSFAVAYMRGRMEGQAIQRDMLNRSTISKPVVTKPQLLTEDVLDRMDNEVMSLNIPREYKNVFGEKITY
jgi:hypothetical protein